MAGDRPRGRGSRSAYGGALDVDVVVQPVLQRTADPPDRACTSSAESMTIPVVYVYLPEFTVSRGHHQLHAAPARMPARGSSCTRRSPTRPSSSMTTGSSSTIRAWQSGSDHRAGTAGGGEFRTPVLRAEHHRDHIGPREALEADPRGMSGVDQLGHRAAVDQRVPHRCSNASAVSRAGSKSIGVRLAHRPHQIRGRWRPPGCRPGTIRRPARRPAAPRRRWRPAPRRTDAAGARCWPRRASCSSDLAGTTTLPQSSARCMTCDQTAASTCSSTLITQGAPANRAAFPAGQPEWAVPAIGWPPT